MSRPVASVGPDGAVTIELGKTIMRAGGVGPLAWTAGMMPGEIEQALGFVPGRLAHGFYVLLLQHAVNPAHVRDDANAVAVAGRFGFPPFRPMVETPVGADESQTDNPQSYWQRKTGGLHTRLSGPERWCQIAPVIPHTDALAHAEPDLPRASRQWTLTNAYPFLMAAHIDAHAIARTVDGLHLDIGPGSDREQRRQLWDALASA